jgi:hypothetical protein
MTPDAGPSLPSTGGALKLRSGGKRAPLRADDARSCRRSRRAAAGRAGRGARSPRQAGRDPVARPGDHDRRVRAVDRSGDRVHPVTRSLAFTGSDSRASRSGFYLAEKSRHRDRTWPGSSQTPSSMSRVCKGAKCALGSRNLASAAKLRRDKSRDAAG